MILKIIPTNLYEKYKNSQPITISKHFNKIKNTEVDFEYLKKASAVYSSMIEGNEIDLDTYYKYYTSGMNTKTRSFKEIEDLENAYSYIQTNNINKKNILQIHKLLSNSNDIEDKYKGKYRDKSVTVNQGNIIIYTGAEAKIVDNEMSKLINDISILIKEKLSISEVFYYSSFVHLILVAIHPFADGNGRIARLIEKWFLYTKLGSKVFGINSEKLYLKRSKSYHKNINKIGVSYQKIDYDYSMSFLKMLPMALKI